MAKIVEMTDTKIAKKHFAMGGVVGTTMTHAFGTRNPMSFERLIFPYNKSQQHWFLFVIYPKLKTIECYDSLHGKWDNELLILLHWFRDIVAPFNTTIHKKDGW